MRLSAIGSGLLVGLLAFGAGCATPRASDADEMPSDPLQPLNRAVFWLNERIDRWALEPVARGYRWSVPRAARDRLGHFLDNLGFPVRCVGNLLQGRFVESGEELGRFFVNTTVGVLGLFDPATGVGLERHPEDVGQALGAWGIGDAPFLVLPLFGPSNPRDALGLVVDTALQAGPALASPIAGTAVSGVRTVHNRSEAIDTVEEARDAALDYYVLRRNAYLQQRRAAVANGSAPSHAPTEDLYEFPEDDE